MNQQIAEIRAEIGYHNLKIKKIAEEMGMKSNLLSMRLHSVRPVSSDFLKSLRETINQLKARAV
jgi:hypothetical protein